MGVGMCRRTVRNSPIIRLLEEAISCEGIGDARVCGLGEGFVDRVVEALFVSISLG